MVRRYWLVFQFGAEVQKVHQLCVLISAAASHSHDSKLFNHSVAQHDTHQLQSRRSTLDAVQ